MVISSQLVDTELNFRDTERIMPLKPEPDFLQRNLNKY